MHLLRSCGIDALEKALEGYAWARTRSREFQISYFKVFTKTANRRQSLRFCGGSETHTFTALRRRPTAVTKLDASSLFLLYVPAAAILFPASVA